MLEGPHSKITFRLRCEYQGCSPWFYITGSAATSGKSLALSPSICASIHFRQAQVHESRHAQERLRRGRLWFLPEEWNFGGRRLFSTCNETFKALPLRQQKYNAICFLVCFQTCCVESFIYQHTSVLWLSGSIKSCSASIQNPFSSICNSGSDPGSQFNPFAVLRLLRLL